MAKVDPKGNLRGTIGPISTRVLDGKNIVQQKSVSQKQSANTKKTAKVFGYASHYSKLIRLALCDIIGKNHDRELFRRFTSTTYKLLQNNAETPLEERTFFNTDMQGLIGFDLNSHSPFLDFCTLPIRVETKDPNTLALILDSFLAEDYFVFPENTTEVQLDFTVVPVLLPSMGPTESTTFSLHFTKTEIMDSQVWETPLALPPYFTIVIAEVNYFQKVNNHKKKSVNNPLFHPAAIVYVYNGQDQMESI